MTLQPGPRLDDTLRTLAAEGRGLDVVLRRLVADDGLRPEQQARCASRVVSAFSARLTEAQVTLHLYSVQGAYRWEARRDLEGGVSLEDDDATLGHARSEAVQNRDPAPADGPSFQPGVVRPRGRATAVALSVVGALLLATVVLRHLTDNVHLVVPGAMYRSAQLDPEELEAVIHRYHIRSVLNLRGARPGSRWYDDEVATAARDGIAHLDLELSPDRVVPVPDADRLLKLLDDLPKPVLIHSEVGADRSGFAAALYRYARSHDAAPAAASQFSAWYGHVPALRNGTAAMDRSFWSYVQAHQL